MSLKCRAPLCGRDVHDHDHVTSHEFTLKTQVPGELLKKVEERRAGKEEAAALLTRTIDRLVAEQRAILADLTERWNRMYGDPENYDPAPGGAVDRAYRDIETKKAAASAAIRALARVPYEFRRER